MSDPVSWLVIEPGWKVVAADGAEVGRVDELIGDTGKDIFNGLSVSLGLLKGRRYVPSEQVASITEGEVALELGSQDFEQLEEYEGAPPSEQFRAD
ncbi:MAG: DUF2171 domain-containing protein [Actinobacteria bacterium]|nr:DUF2171 domain-containing protein [Actinomycetota bacterium]